MGSAVLREPAQFAKRRILPVYRAQNNRDDAGLASLMALQGSRHLFLVAVVGADEVGANEQQDDVGAVEVVVDFVGPLIARKDTAIVPGLDETLPLQQLQVGFELLAQDVVFVGVAVEQAQGVLAL